MSLKSNVELMANYNHWMNKSIYETASQLSTDQLSEDRGAFFISIIGTLNHILVGDIIWLKRFANHPYQLKSLDEIRSLEDPKALSDVLHPTLKELKRARIKMDHIIQGFASELTHDILSSTLSYSNMKGESLTSNMGYLVQHFFNHQTHHRGQVSTLLNQAGLKVGATDLLFNIPNEEEI